MTRALENIRVAIPENRYPEQLTTLLEREGATVVSCPLVRETPHEDSEGARRFIELCETGAADYVIFYTGVGVNFLLRAVNKPAALAGPKILARGPKAVAALRRAGVRIDFIADSPTTEGILETLSRQEMKDKSVLVQLYGQENAKLCSTLESWGASVTAISLYRYTYASDDDAIAKLFAEIREGRVDAICFTSAPQIRFLMAAAAEQGVEDEIRSRLSRDVVIVSIGEVTARALSEAGLAAHIIPQDPRMGPMVKALANFFERRRSACSTPSS